MIQNQTLFKTNSRKFYTLSKTDEAKNPTLTSGTTSPYSKYMGVPPLPGRFRHWDPFVLFLTAPEKPGSICKFPSEIIRAKRESFGCCSVLNSLSEAILDVRV